MKVYERLASAFAAEGVSHIFGIMGDGNMYWIHVWVAKPGPMMVDVRISRNVLTLPYRRIHYGRDE